MLSIKKIGFFILALVLFNGVQSFAQATDTDVKMEVSDAELNDFANVYLEVFIKNREAQSEMVKEIESEGLTIQEYHQMSSARGDLQKISLSKEKLAKKDIVDGKMQKINDKLQNNMDEIIGKSQMGKERYEQIAEIIGKNDDLREKFQNILMKQ